MGVAAWLPGSLLGPYLGLTPLPGLYWPLLGLTLLCYLGLTQLVKTAVLRRRWI
jgi:Mg2+-importing ATPase